MNRKTQTTNIREAIKELTLRMSVKFVEEYEEELDNLMAVHSMCQHNLRVKRNIKEQRYE